MIELLILLRVNRNRAYGIKLNLQFLVALSLFLQEGWTNEVFPFFRGSKNRDFEDQWSQNFRLRSIRSIQNL